MTPAEPQPQPTLIQRIRNHRFFRAGLVVFCVVYLLNPTWGILEFVPDNIPFVGGVDELAIMFLLGSLISIFPISVHPSTLRWIILVLIGVVSLFVTFSPSAGIVELIPDNFPLVGNLDDAISAFALSTVLSQVWHQRLEKAKTQTEKTSL
jgi:uncharacterized membrane protein YkvA (DUF1232 family)